MEDELLCVLPKRYSDDEEIWLVKGYAKLDGTYSMEELEQILFCWKLKKWGVNDGKMG